MSQARHNPRPTDALVTFITCKAMSRLSGLVFLDNRNDLLYEVGYKNPQTPIEDVMEKCMDGLTAQAMA